MKHKTPKKKISRRYWVVPQSAVTTRATIDVYVALFGNIYILYIYVLTDGGFETRNRRDFVILVLEYYLMRTRTPSNASDRSVAHAAFKDEFSTNFSTSQPPCVLR